MLNILESHCFVGRGTHNKQLIPTHHYNLQFNYGVINLKKKSYLATVSENVKTSILFPLLVGTVFPSVRNFKFSLPSVFYVRNSKKYLALPSAIREMIVKWKILKFFFRHPSTNNRQINLMDKFAPSMSNKVRWRWESIAWKSHILWSICRWNIIQFSILNSKLISMTTL